MRGRSKLVLDIVRTDATFERRDVRGERLWVGRCIHCASHLTVSEKGDLLGATIEHILPTTHGGTDALENVALACARCNHRKGSRLDSRRRDDPTLVAVIETLRERRRARWREG